MRSTIGILFVLILLASSLAQGAPPSLVQPAESGDRTLSPYFFVKSNDPALDPLPLKATKARVHISGIIADVQVTQIYKNEGRNPIEAVYIFPASTKAAVYGMKMTIGERIIEAKIEKREQARLQYEQARDQGKTASLLEQQRPNVFQMNVANILPKDEIKVELRYTELLAPFEGIYEFIYPTVVGPRYSNQKAEKASSSEQWVQNPYLRQEETPSYTFDIGLALSAGIPIQEIFCLSHKVTTVYDGPNIAKVNLTNSETYGGNRDYVLRYRLAGDRINSGLLLFSGEKENFFLLMMQPPKRIKTSDIPGREYIFIVDVSGSMHGFPLEISKKLLRDLIGNLRSSDRFNLLLFSGGSSVMAEQSVPATPENITRAMDLINRQKGGGGTELLPALTRALRMPKPENFSRTFIIATDGYVTVEEEVFDLMRNNLGEANMFTFGIGTAVNRHLIEGMARIGMGEPFVISKPGEAPLRAEQFRAMIQSPMLTQIKMKFQDFAVYEVEPPAVPDILADRPVMVFGKWRGRPSGRIIMTGISGQGPFTETIQVGALHPSDENSALRYLWARHRISHLSDYNRLRAKEKRAEEITELGLAYNLLTPYTSFVAIDNEVRNMDGKSTTVKQPLPLPQGVSDYAIGGSIAAQAYAPAAKASLPGEGEAFRSKEVSKDKEELKSRIINVVVSDGLSKETVLKAVNSNLQDIGKICLPEKLKGRASIIITLNAEGKVKKVSVTFGERNDKNTEKCIQDWIKKWKFPASENQQEVRIEVSLQFS